MLTAICVIVALAAGAGLGWLASSRQVRAVELRARSLADAVRKMAHDLRGALSPAMLMAERLESHADPAVSQAAGTISKALDRATDAAKPAAALARSFAPPARQQPGAGK